MAEQNVDIMAEIENLKKGVKLAFVQVTEDFEAIMNAAREATTKQNLETEKLLLDIQKKMTDLEKREAPKSKESCCPPTISQPSVPS